jgi:hypothetical protein
MDFAFHLLGLIIHQLIVLYSNQIKYKEYVQTNSFPSKTWSKNFRISVLWFHDRCSPVTFAPEAQIKPQSKPKLTLCLALTHTYILILTQTRAYTPNYSESKCRWGASVPRATVVLPCFIHRRGGRNLPEIDFALPPPRK